MASHQVLQSSLDSFWVSNFEEDKSVRILRSVKTILDPVLVELCKREPLLDFNPLNTSSLHQGKTSNILEVILCLKNFDSSEHMLSIEDGNSPIGFAFAKLSGKRTSWDEFCIKSNSGKKYLSAKIISEKLHGHLRALLSKKTLTQHVNEFQTELMEHLEDNAVSIKLFSSAETFTLHIIPTIPCKGRWTFGANPWLSEESHWPSKAMKHEAMNKGIHLVGRSAPTKSPCQWQIAFLEPWRMLLSDGADNCRTKCLETFNLILNRSPLLQKGVTLFLLETVALNLYKKYGIAFSQQGIRPKGK